MSEQRWKEGDPPEFLVPRTCSQCGQPWIHRACGPTHAIIVAGFIVGRSALRDGPLADLRSRLAAAERERDEANRRTQSHIEDKHRILREYAVKTVEVEKRLAAVNAEIGRLKAIVGRLPKTKDGVPMAPGMRVWTGAEPDDEHLVTGVTNFNACECGGDGEESFFSGQHDCHELCDHAIESSAAYSTQAAAIAARAAEGRTE